MMAPMTITKMSMHMTTMRTMNMFLMSEPRSASNALVSMDLWTLKATEEISCLFMSESGRVN